MNQTLAVKIITAILLAGMLLGCSSETSEETPAPEGAGLLDLESFLTNVSDTAGDRYCKLTVKLVVSPKEMVAEIGEDPLLKARIHDEVLTLLSAKSFEDVNNPAGREAFREEIRAKLGEVISKGEVQQVLFSEFIVQ